MRCVVHILARGGHAVHSHLFVLYCYLTLGPPPGSHGFESHGFGGHPGEAVSLRPGGGGLGVTSSRGSQGRLSCAGCRRDGGDPPGRGTSSGASSGS